MILIFATQKSPRLEYILAELLDRRAGFVWQLTTNENEFENFSGARINYSEKTFDDSINIHPDSLLFEKEIRSWKPEIKENKIWNKIFFSQTSEIPFDIFSTSFYLLSRYEEYLPHKKDEHGRFAHEQSLAFQNNFIEIPLVDAWAQTLKEKILTKFSVTQFRENKFKFISTIDIDFAYKYKGIGLRRHFLKFGKSIFQFRFYDAVEQIQVALTLKKDPYDTYQLIENISPESNYFVLMRTGTQHDKNIFPESPEMEILLKELLHKNEIGLHPSYFSENKIEREKLLLEKVIEEKINSSRQHFLKFVLPETYRELIGLNFTDEYSMAYSGICGFRASTSFPFFFFNLEKNETTSLLVHPTIVMDVTLKNSQKLSPEKAIDKIEQLINEVKKVNGTFISLWHNSSLCEDRDWKGWTKVFENLHTLAAKNSAQ